MWPKTPSRSSWRTSDRSACCGCTLRHCTTRSQRRGHQEGGPVSLWLVSLWFPRVYSVIFQWRDSAAKRVRWCRCVCVCLLVCFRCVTVGRPATKSEAGQFHVHSDTGRAHPRGSAASLQGKSLLQPRALGLSGLKSLAPPLSAASLHGNGSHRVRVALGTVRSGVCVLGTSRILEAWRLQDGVQPRFKVGISRDLKSYQKLAKQDGVKFIEVDMCMFGGTHKGQIGILTKCEWIQETLCSQVKPHKHVHFMQNDTVWFASLANEHPDQWYTTVTMGFKDALAKGLTFNEVKAAKQNHLEDFAGSFFKGPYIPGPRQEREEANTATVGGTKAPQPRSCSLQGSSQNKVVCTWYPRAGYPRQSFLPGGSGVARYARLQGLLPRVAPVRAHRLVRWFPHQEGLRQEAAGAVRLHPLGALARASAIPRRRCFGVVTGRLPCGNWRVGHRGKFPTSVRSVFGHFCGTGLCASPGPQGLELRRPPQPRLFRHGLLKYRAADEITRIEHEGFIETFTDWKQVTERWPNAVASKVAVLLKTREDGTTKVRLIIDLRRSGGNGGVELPERVVLPRLSDLTNSTLDLMVCVSESSTRRKYRLRLVGCRFRRCFSHVGDSRAGPWCHGHSYPRRLGSYQATLLWNGSGTAGMVSGECCSGAPGTSVLSTKRVTNTNLCRRPSNRHT